jgi:hypothetical protein
VTTKRLPGTPVSSKTGDLSKTGNPHPDRRSVAAGLAALLAVPGSALLSGPAMAARGNWTIATQIVAGTRLADPNVLEMAVAALEKEVGADVVARLYQAILARDAASIVEPFADKDVESAARRFFEMIYTGEIEPGTTAAFHQALAWQVLPFTKPPSICGPDMGWWTYPPDEAG